MRILFLLAIFVMLGGGAVMAYEEPEYGVVKEYDTFELRRYEPYIVAEVEMTGDFDEVGGSAFRKLFGYISEDDRPQGEIAMTVPVIQQPTTDAEERKNYRFAFVMPEGYELNDLPVPEDTEIRLRDVPTRLMAARRYSGTWSEERYRKNEQILLESVRRAGLTIVGQPIFARYNAPFSLWFLRRNEVLVEIDPDAGRNM